VPFEDLGYQRRKVKESARFANRPLVAWKFLRLDGRKHRKKVIIDEPKRWRSYEANLYHLVVLVWFSSAH
jgi:hypothetical protein